MAYIPQQGDVIYLDFDPQSGHEQKGRRPAIVISNNAFNALSCGALVCPITNTNLGIPLHVQLDSRTKTTGVIMVFTPHIYKKTKELKPSCLSKFSAYFSLLCCKSQVGPEIGLNTGATEEIRTPDLLITNQLLCLLSYSSI